MPRLVIGRRRDLASFADLQPFRTVQGRGWTLAGNLALLGELGRGPVGFATAPGPGVKGLEAPSFFAWECGWLGLHGHPELCPPGLRPYATATDPCHAALVAEPGAFHARLRGRALRGDDAMPELGPVLARMAWAAQVFDPLLAREGWDLLAHGAPYRPVLRFTLAWTSALDALVRAAHPGLPRSFTPKVLGEFDALLDLHPAVFAFPTFEPLSRNFLLRLRGVPVHPLGLILAPRFTDGGLQTPLEHFLHDLDHARHKVREDLVHRGFSVDDPYRCLSGGAVPTTLLDPGSGRHRVVLHQAAEVLRARRPASFSPRHDPDFIPRLLGSVQGLDAAPQSAVLELLFEIVHEKSLPFVPEVLVREAVRTAHLDKLRAKVATGFHGTRPPCAMEQLETAPGRLAELVKALAS